MTLPGDAYLIYGSSKEPRLTPEEAERMAIRLYHSHNHDATAPQQAIFWLRVPWTYRA